MKKVFLLVLLVALALAGVYYYQEYSKNLARQEQDIRSNGRLELARYFIQSMYAARVEDILVEEGDNVEEGQIIILLSAQELEEKRKVALAAHKRAQEAVVRAEAIAKRAEQAIARSGGGAAQSKAQTKSIEAQLAIAETELENARKLRKENLISNTELSQRQKSRDAQRAAVNAAKAGETQALSAQEEAKIAWEEARAGVAEARAIVEQTNAEISAIDAVIKELEIRSPVAGRIEYINVKRGQIIAPAQTLASVFNPEDVELHIFLPLEALAKIHVQTPAKIKIDGWQEELPAFVARIADTAQFTPKYVETMDARTKLVYKVSLKLEADSAKKYKTMMKSGIPATAIIVDK